MFKAVWNNKEFTITGVPSISDSSRESKFSDLQVDFTNLPEEDLPIQYQEIKIFKGEELFAVGYVDAVFFPEFTSENQPFLISISLISPYGYTSKRTLSIAINTEDLSTSIDDILAPLIEDGFTIEFKELADREVSEIFRGESVEKIMNYMARKYGFVWYIDRQKKIYLYDLNFLRGQEVDLVIDNHNNKNLHRLQPFKTVVDYANQIILKDFFLLSEARLLNEGTILKTGEEYALRYPFSISENVRKRIPDTGIESIFYLNTDVETWYWLLNGTVTSNIGFAGEDDEDTSKTLLLIRDGEDSTKITGFKYNGIDDATVADFSQTVFPNVSFTSLVPYIFRISDPAEITRISDKTKTSGIIEKPIKLNGRYLTVKEINELAQSLFIQNNVSTNEIKASFKGTIQDMEELENKLIVTKKISINLPKFKVNDNFIITDTTKTFGRETIQIDIIAKNYNLNENFNDIFRLPDEQLSTDDLINEISAFFLSGEQLRIKKDITIDGEVETNV